jgi:Ca2+-binding EF-hand superfamily protein
MGKGESKIIHMIPSDLLQVYIDEYKSLGFTSKEICLFHNLFRDISSSSPSLQQPQGQRNYEEGGEIDPPQTVTLEQVLKYFALEKTSFTKLLFQSFDVDHLVEGDGAIDFPRLLQAIWNFCTLDDDALSAVPTSSHFSYFLSLSSCAGSFIFTVYDRNRDDYLPRKEIAAIVRGMYGSEFDESDDAIM